MDIVVENGAACDVDAAGFDGNGAGEGAIALWEGVNVDLQV